MPDSQNPEHVRKLIDEFQLKGANLIPTVTAEIVPTVLVADLTAVGPHSNDRLCWGGVLGAASGVGNQQNTRLLNPANSQTLLVVERVWCFNRTAADHVEFIVGSGGSGTAALGFRDTRVAGLPVGQLISNAAAAKVLGIVQFPITVLAATFFDVQVVLTPNNFLRLTQENQNEGLTTGFLWRERDLLPVE